MLNIKRLIVLFVLGIAAPLSAQNAAPSLNVKYHDSKKCMACHIKQVKKWSNSYHAKSHYNSDEYLRKTMDYYSRKTRRPINAVKVECAACHNPRIAVTSTDDQYHIDVLFGLDKNSHVNKAVSDSSLSEGVNCLVCHNVDKILDHLPEDRRGVHRIAWNKVGTMSGPFKNVKSPYHQSQYRDFFEDKPEKLCFVCHANDRSKEGLLFTNMKAEYKKSDQTCTDCHMGPKKEGIASNLPMNKGKPFKRMVRDHNFAGAHVSWMWEAALKISAKRQGKRIHVTISNDIPHNIPSGFGARELVLDVTYRSGTDVLRKKSVSLTQRYRDKRGKPTIPHLAKTATKDASVPAQGSKVVKLPVIDGAGQVMIELSYRLVNDEIRKMLKLEDPIWSKKHPIDRTLLRM